MKTLLKHGTVIDGSGASAYQASLVMEDGVISEIVTGEVSEHFSGEVINCSGKVIAPGFIDAHSHNDWYATREDPVSFFKPFAEQGITTQVAGNCGFSPFGYKPGTVYKSLLGGGMFETKEDADYSALSAWRDAAEKITPLNIIPHQGHASLRASIAGYENRPLTGQETTLKNAKIEESLEQGAFGLSFGLMYEPDRYAPAAELEEAAKIAVKYGGIITVHARAFSRVSTSYSPPIGGEAHNIRALKEMIELTRRTGARLQYSHLIFVGRATWKTVDESLALIDKARSEGVDIVYDLYSMTFGVSVITVVLPSWYLSMPKEKRESLGARARLALEIGLTKRLLGFDFSDMEIAWVGEGGEALCGRRVTDIAKEWKVSDLEAYIRIVDMGGGKGRVNLYRYYDEPIIERLMRHEPSLFMTDAWIEDFGVQNASAFSCFPKFLAISRDKNTISLEATVRKMTGAAADRFGIPNRGYLKKGYAADVTVFDPATVGANADPLQRPEGICHVFVNGRHIVKDGAATESAMRGAGSVIAN